MLSKQNRLSTEDLRDFQKGTKTFSISRDGILIELRIRTHQASKKFGVSCSKKVINTAVGRNDIRRIIYSTLSQNLHKIRCGFEGLFIIRKYNGNKELLRKIIISLLEKGDLVSHA